MAVHFCGVHSGRDVDKLRYLNVAAVRAKSVSPLQVDGCIGVLECRVRDVAKIGNRPFISGELLHLSVDPRYGNDEGWYTETELIQYEGGNKYRVKNRIIDLSRYRPGYIPPDSIGEELSDDELILF